MAMTFFLVWQATPTLANEEVLDNTNTLESVSTLTTGTPEEFGANPFDEEDDTEAIQKALDTFDIVELKDGGTYYISDILRIRSSQKLYTPNLSATIIQTENLPAILNTYKLKTTVKVNQWIKNGQTSIPLETEKEGTVNNPDIQENTDTVVYPDTQENTDIIEYLDIQPNDLVVLRSNKLWKEDNRGYLKKGELHTAKSYENGLLELSEGIFDAYATAETVSVNIYEPMSIHLENIILTRSNDSAYTNYLISLWYTQNSVLNNISVSNATDSGIILQYNYRTSIDNSYFNLGVVDNIPQTGYGIQDNGGVYTHISNSTFMRVRRGVDLSGNIPNWNSVVENCYAYGPYKGSTLASGNSGFGTHSTAVNSVFRNNYIKGFSQAFALRGNNTTIENNTVEGNQSYFLQATHGTNIVVRNNEYIRFSKKTKMPIFANLTRTFNGKITLTKNTSSPVSKWTSKKNNTKTSGNKIVK